MKHKIIRTKQVSALTPKEADFLSKLAEKGTSIFTFEQAQALWTPHERVPDALYRLAQKGWLCRLKPGVYLLIPLEADPGRAWTGNSWEIAQYLTSPAVIAYWSALRYWNLTEQIPQVTFVQTKHPPRHSAEIAGMKFRFVTVIERHFFGSVPVNISGKTIQIADREKTLIDCASRPELSGGILQLAQALRSNQTQIHWEKLDQYLRQWGGGAAVKRLGYLVETLKIPGQADRLARWQSLTTRGICPLEPGANKIGIVLTRWQLRVNVSIPENQM